MKQIEKITIIEKDANGNMVKETTTIVEKEYIYTYSPSSPSVSPAPSAPYWSYPLVICGSASISGNGNTFSWN